MRQIEASAKKVEQAVEEGLRILGVSESEVKVEILSTGGWFRKAKVRLTVVDENGNPIEDKDLSSVTEEDLKNFGVSETPKVDLPQKSKDKPYKPERKGEQKGEKPERKAEQKSERQAEKKSEKPNKVEVKKEQPAKPLDKNAQKGEHGDKKVKDKKPFEHKEHKAPESPRPAPMVAEKLPPVDEELAKKAKDYLEKLLAKMSVESKVEMKTDDGVIALDIVTEDGSVIGHHGEVLDAIQTLTKRAICDADDKYIHLVVDSKNYRKKRESSLIALAEKMAAKCIRTGKKVVLEPMSNAHRKIIHATLTQSDKVITRSEGREPNRRIVILPKRADKEKN